MKISCCSPFVLLAGLAACALPAPAPVISQHDLGGVFAVGEAHNPLPLRAVQVVSSPVLAGMGMQYREAAQPTRRAVYAFNRWAATPASMVESALQRELARDGAGRCRLQYVLTEFIIDIDAQGHGRALLSADASLAREMATPVSQHSFDIAVPMSDVSPAAGALALREATRQLATATAGWLGSDVARPCLP